MIDKQKHFHIYYYYGYVDGVPPWRQTPQHQLKIKEQKVDKWINKKESIGFVQLLKHMHILKENSQSKNSTNLSKKWDMA